MKNNIVHIQEWKEKLILDNIHPWTTNQIAEAYTEKKI